MKIAISDDLYDESKYGYFASAKFHARLRKMNGVDHECPDGRAGRRWIEKQLGCKYVDFMAFLESIVDEEGFAYVPDGLGKCVAFPIGKRSRPMLEEHHISPGAKFSTKH